MVAVEDSGPGIPEHLFEQIFDPFFSTKGDNSLGLGLAISRNIIERHKGTLTAGRAPGGGARFVMSLPVADVESAPVEAPGIHHRGGKRVLVIDDEAPLRRVLGRILKSSGHQPVLANGGQAGIDLIVEDPTFDAIVCDLMMPGVSGVMVLDFLEANYPEQLARTMILTGGALNQTAAAALRRHQRRVLQKPLGPQEFMTAVEAILETSR